MNGIIINIDPVIFHLGGFELRWYSLTIMLAVLSAVLITAHQAKKRGIEADEIYSLAVWVVLGGVVGARLFHVIDQFGYYAANPLYIVQLQRGGLAIWGALAGGGVALLIYARVRHLPLGRLADALAPALLAAHIIGRFGCIVNGDAYGGVTSLPWGFIYTHPGAMIPQRLFGLPTHPYPAYEIIWDGLALLAIVWLSRFSKREGLLFFSYLFLYSMGRFLLTFVREETQVLWGLQQAQVIALLVMVAAVIVMGKMYLNGRRLVPEPAESS